MAVASLTDMWWTWVKEAGTLRSTNNLVSVKFLEECILKDLHKAGFDVPVRRACRELLGKDLEPLPELILYRKEAFCCSFVHLMNLLRSPILEYMGACASPTTLDTPEWTERLRCNHNAIVREMAGLVQEPEEVLDMCEFCAYIQTNLTRLLKVDVSKSWILAMCSHLVPFTMPPTRATALHLLRSGLCADLVGPALALQVQRQILSEVADLPVDLLSDAALALKVFQERVDALVSAEPDGEEECVVPAKKKAEPQQLKPRPWQRKPNRSCLC